VADVTLLGSPNPLDVAAELVREALERVGPGARLGIPGGSALEVLARVRAALEPSLWRTLKLTWVDERVVPFADAQSNRGSAYRSKALDVDQPVGLELPLVLDGESASTAVKRSTDVFEREFGGALDVALLGMGEDGHIASLFPGHAGLNATGLVAAIEGSPKPPSQRLTLTLPVLARAGLARYVVAIGAGKRDAVMRLVAGDDIPAARLGAVTVVTD
jgi:6-phosphogluconolactonase